MEKKFELLPPLMPNFVRFKQEAGLRQDGFKVNDGFPIIDFTQKEAEEYAELMSKAFMEHWRNKVELKNKFK